MIRPTKRDGGMTTGAMISTLCFAAAALGLADAALEAEGARALALGACAIAAGAGALRFQIAAAAAWFRERG
ncbi:MAG: hypothetical protein N4A39_04485 [Roseicyclus sp.]|jgi:hypothetical protein|nr:hypothetical protein [Roseicyclus sp.]